jgi:RNA polymerase sigma factor (sigma-70 family)
VTAADAHRTIDAVWKLESGRVIAGLTRMVRDVGLAEEFAQDALVAALEQWPTSGVPANPGAWLMAIAKRRAVDHLRRAERLERKTEVIARDLESQPDSSDIDDAIEELDDEVGDDLLRLIFISCHPVLPTTARVALTLRLLGGLTTDEIARAFLAAEPTIAQRIVRAKRTLAEQHIPFEVPVGPELAERLASVLEVIYLVFNEGYSATTGEDWMRPTLCQEALRLGRILAELAPGAAEVHGLVALMEIQASRSVARTGPAGEPIPLLEQNRGRWDQLLIRRGFAALLRAKRIGGPPGPYVLQAAIAVCHAQARTADETDWAQIVALYDGLARLLPTPVVRLNQAVAVAMARGPVAGLALVDQLTGEPTLQGYHLLPSVRGDLLAKLGRHGEAAAEFERAASATRNLAERTLLTDRATAARQASAGVTLAVAADGFLARSDVDSETARSYGQTLRRLRQDLGERVALASVTPDQVAEVFAAAWGNAAARTWNRHRSAVRSFQAWAAEQDWPVGDLASRLDRKQATDAPAKAIDRDGIETLCERADTALRERTLWRLLYESASRAGAALSLDVENLDLANNRGRVGQHWVRWGDATADLLPALILGRTRGPVFLADRKPAPARTPADVDLCPVTGRRRLSYERAEYLFKQATKPHDPTGHGYTLRQLRHSRLTHLAEGAP